VPDATTQTRIKYFDALRAWAAVAVVVIHAAAPDWGSLPPTDLQWQAVNIYDGLARWSVPIFFMVSGALFLDPQREITTESVYRKSLPRLLYAFLPWSVFYALLERTGDGAGAVALAIVVGHDHMWFLWALAGLYAAAPLLRPIAANRSLARYFVWLGLVVTSALPLLAAVPGPDVVGLPIVTAMQLSFGYALYFMLGHLLATTQRPMRLAWLWTLLGVAATIAGTSVWSVLSGEPIDVLYDYLMPPVVLASIGVFAAARRRHDRGRSTLVRLLADHSLGIYLSHIAFLMLYESVGPKTAPVLQVPLETVFALAGSLALAVVVKRIPRVGPYLA